MFDTAMAETGRRALKVGELAERTGLTVRTLHHYDDIGLLPPSRRTASGHRLYGADAVARLQQVLSLRQLGLSLDEIGELLDDEGTSLESVLRLHLERLRQKVAMESRLCRRLEATLQHIDAGEQVDVDELLEIMEAMAMFEKYFTPEQLETLEKRKEMVGEERIKQVEQEWQEIFAAVRGHIEKGTPPDDPEVLELSRRARGLIEEFSGGDPEIEASVARMYRGEPSARERTGADPAIMEYLGKAAAARDA